VFVIVAANFSELNVHIVPHSHLDAGWLESIDQYYIRGVEKIFTSVV